jgi:exo-1,4-beta-D-glucosaminidase
LTEALPSAAPVSTNFYWLSTRPDVLDWSKAKWFYTPTRSHGDLKALSKLPPTHLSISARADATQGTVVTVENAGTSLAFQIHLKLVDGKSGEELLPVFWDDNYFALMPGERRDIRATSPLATPASLAVEADAWNVARTKVEVRISSAAAQ